MAVSNQGMTQKIYTPTGDNLGDIRKIINILLRNWYFFVIFISLSMGAVFIFHRYTPNIYRSSITMLFKSGSNRNSPQSSLIEGFGPSIEMHNIENQTFIIKTNKMVRRAINLLDFEVSYFKEGRFKDTELYDPIPFLLKFDTLKPQLVNKPIKMQFFPDKTVKVTLSTIENGALYNYKTFQNTGYSNSASFETIIKQGEIVKHPAFSFSLHQTESGQWPSQGNYYVVFNSYESLTGKFRSSLQVSNYRDGSSIFFVSVTGPQPKKLVKFLNVFSEEILENNLERKNYMASRSLSFIQRQLNTVADTLKIIQKRMMDFRQTNRFLAPSEMSQRISSEFFEREKEKRMLDLKYDYFNNLKQRIEIDDYEESDFLLPMFVKDDAGLVPALVSEHMALLKERQLMSDYAGPDNPFRSELDRKIVLSKESLIIVLGKQLETIILKKNEIDTHTALLYLQFNDLPLLEREFFEIERAFKLNDAIYTFLLQKNSETQISRASNVPDNEILDQASITGAISPNKKNNFAKAAIIGLLIPCLIVFLKEFFNTRIRGIDELKNLFPSIPVLGNIFHNQNEDDCVVLNNPGSAIAEAFRSLRLRLRFMLPPGKEGKIISVTSTCSGEGKTFCTINLATVFAMAGLKCVIAGFDMRKPSLAKVFNLPDNMGISNYLINQVELDDIIIPSNLDNLFIITSGIIPPNPSELIISDKNISFLNELKSRFDIIILDTPPLGIVSDARSLIEYSDCHLFVVRPNVSPKEHLISTMSNLLSENVQHIGFILNDLRSGKGSYGYYYSSGYYGSGYYS